MVSVLIAVMFCDFEEVSARKHKTVPEKKRHELLDGGPYTGVWETGDLKLNYQYAREPGRLRISGTILFGRARRIDDFSFELNLINAEGKILLKELIASVGGRRPVQEIPFESDIKIPDETWGVAFSDEGSSGGGAGGGGSSSFWQSPF